MMMIIFVIISINCLLLNCYSRCPELEDCFSCHDKGYRCEWSDNKCNIDQSIVNIDTSSERKWAKMISCLDNEQSKEIMNTYCGDLNLNLKDKFQSISLPRVNDFYGRESLLCMYVYKNSNPKDTIYADINVLSKYFFSAKFLIEAIFKDGASIKQELVITQNLVRIENAKEIYFYYRQTDPFPELPFMMTLTLEKAKISITLIVTIVLLVFLTIICSISIYIFSQRIARRNKMIRNARQEELNVLQGGINNEQVARVLDQILKEARLKEIENMFTNVMKAIPFDKTVGKYNTSCTICLEEFQEEHIVCVTECLHVFHVECLKKWLITNVMNPKCPNCACCLLKDTKENQPNQNNNNVIQVERQLNTVANTINLSSNNRMNRSVNNDNTNEILVRENEREVVKDINKIAKEKKNKENKTAQEPIVLNRVNQNNRNLTNLREYELNASHQEMEENNIHQISNKL